LLSSRLVLLTYQGRRTGRSRTIPVLYATAADGGVVALAAGPEAKQWWRTFSAGAPATLRLDGRVVPAEGHLLGGAEAREALRVYLGRFPRAARTLGAVADGSDAELTAAAAAVALVRFELEPAEG
jgi:deazaflavin-dependent oxidoreductase (nitroreductase family)